MSSSTERDISRGGSREFAGSECVQRVSRLVEGTGFGPATFDTAGLFEQAASVTIDHNPELGESDPYFHRR